MVIPLSPPTTFEPFIPLTQLSKDYFDSEWHDNAVSTVHHAMSRGQRPSKALVHHLLALSLCSLTFQDPDRPSAYAIEMATFLISQLGASWPHSPNEPSSSVVAKANADLATHSLRYIPSFDMSQLPMRGRARSASVVSDDANWLNPVEKWIQERVQTANDVWDLLSGGRTALTKSDERPPRLFDEFWMTTRKRRLVESGVSRKRRKAKSNSSDEDIEYQLTKKDEEPLQLSEGAWRTLKALVFLWDVEDRSPDDTPSSLADQFQPSGGGYMLQLRSPWGRRMPSATLSTEVGKALDIIFSFPSALGQSGGADISSRASTAAGLLILLHRLGLAKKLNLDSVIQGATNRMGQLSYEDVTYLAKPLGSLHPELLVRCIFSHLKAITRPHSGRSRSSSPEKRSRSSSPSKPSRSGSDRSRSSSPSKQRLVIEDTVTTKFTSSIVGKVPTESRLYEVAKRAGLAGPVSRLFKLEGKFSDFPKSSRATRSTALLRLEEMRERLRTQQLCLLLIQILIKIESHEAPDLLGDLLDVQETGLQRTIRKMMAGQRKALKRDTEEFEECVDEMFRHSVKDVANLCENVVLSIRQLEASLHLLSST